MEEFIYSTQYIGLYLSLDGSYIKFSSFLKVDQSWDIRINKKDLNEVIIIKDLIRLKEFKDDVL